MMKAGALTARQHVLLFMTREALIAVPNGSKQIHLIKQNEEVLAASTRMANGKLELAWEAIKVHFSSGSEAGSLSTMVYLELKCAEGSLIYSLDQILLLDNGKYIIASRLQPGQSLVDKDGKGLLVKRVIVGEFNRGVHGIMTMAPMKDSPDGHLLLAQGVVVGDFWMQINFRQLSDSMKEAD